MGLEPTPGPWQGPVLPLYYDRSNHRNSSTTAIRRQVPIDGRREWSSEFITGPSAIHPRGPGESLPDLKHARCFHYRRFSLPFSEA